MSAVSTESFIDSELNFGLDMLRQVPANAQTVVSPLSVILALAMVQAGARGRTRAQINEHISNGADNVDIENFYSKLSQDVLNATNDVQTRIANAFYMDKRYTIEKQYEATIRKKYSAKVEALDFEAPKAAAQIIDKFISDTTEGKIKNMVNEKMVMDAFSLIVNAIYFKAKWLRDFNKDLTKKATFHCSENEQKQIEFMNEYQKNRLYAENDDLQVLTLPYKDTTYALSILLPKKRFALAEIRNKITGSTLRELLRQVKMEFMTISVPKMKIETKFELKKALISMGITEMFTDNADFTGITKEPPLKVSDAAHRALIEVDEEGTVAAAATVITMVKATALRPQKKPITFIADHPFIFILTKNDSPIFTGQFIA
ncbi:unnamed protein product [Cylicocyclus nassatus]|uniref:Serpin domain-containing protein n=1 Tax=Cylicocyclus nassatus TaxID=53992 RepID=A0AA36M6X4_CYLNA|nr:unnamed protein product [Cylicocyclus nassatus]